MVESAGLGLSSALRVAWTRRAVGLVVCSRASSYFSSYILTAIDSFFGDDELLEKSSGCKVDTACDSNSSMEYVEDVYDYGAEAAA